MFLITGTQGRAPVSPILPACPTGVRYCAPGIVRSSIGGAVLRRTLAEHCLDTIRWHTGVPPHPLPVACAEQGRTCRRAGVRPSADRDTTCPRTGGVRLPMNGGIAVRERLASAIRDSVPIGPFLLFLLSCRQPLDGSLQHVEGEIGAASGQLARHRERGVATRRGAG